MIHWLAKALATLLLLTQTAHSFIFYTPACYLTNERLYCPDLTLKCRSCTPCAYADMIIDCSNSILTTLSSGMFSSVKLFNNSYGINIKLQNAGISSVDDDAFLGVESLINTLHLEHNQLTTIPAALGKLHNLKDLQIYGNPIRSISSDVLSAFADGLTDFSISLGHMSSYPMALNDLHAVIRMYLMDISFELMDQSIFKGWNVAWLNLIYSTDFHGRVIPQSVLNLSNLMGIMIRGSQPVCDCSLAYLKGWNATRYLIQVNNNPHVSCGGRTTLNQFIQGGLEHCSG